MLLDTHLHTAEYSEDSFLPVRDAVAAARMKGLDGLCVTDHDSMGMMAEARELARELDFPIFVGIEVLTSSGDFVAFGPDNIPDYTPGKLDVGVLVDYVKSKGGAVVAAHPYRDNGRGAGDLIRTLPRLDGVECFNGSTPHEANLMALNAARERGLACLGAGDSHLPERVGVFATNFRFEARDERELARLITCGECEPVAWDGAAFVPAEAWTLSQISRSTKS